MKRKPHKNTGARQNLQKSLERPAKTRISLLISLRCTREEASRPWLAIGRQGKTLGCVVAKADLSLHGAHVRFCRFCLAPASKRLDAH